MSSAPGATLEAVVSRPGKSPVVKRFRDSHHLVAKLFALGLRPGAVATAAGYCLSRISILSADPSFQELISYYRSVENEAFSAQRDEYWERATRVRGQTLRAIEDKLEDIGDNVEEVSFRELLTIHDSLADRTGYGKRATNVNINVDFAEQLERAIQRSRQADPTIEHAPQGAEEAGQMGEVGTSRHLHASPPLSTSARFLPAERGRLSVSEPSARQAAPTNPRRDIPRRIA